MKKMHTLSGNITFSVIGAYTEKFISDLIDSGIKIKRVYNKNNVVYIDARRIDYKKIAKIAVVNRVRTRIEKRYGIYYKLRRISKRTGIVAGIFVSVIIVLIMQQFIWKINIHGIDNVSENLIIETISDNGIHLGCLIQTIDTKKAEIQLKKAIKSLSWVNIEQNGSRIDVYVREDENPEKSEISLDTPCNIVADKTGIIVETEVYSGTLMYTKGSGVSKGSVIVSGIVNDGADNIILSHANAKIIAEFTETVEFKQEYNTIEKEFNGITETEKELMIFGFVIPLSDKITDKNNKVCDESIEICKIFGINMPWKIKTNTYSSYENISVKRTSEDAIKLVEQKLEMYCNNFFSQYEIMDISKSFKADKNGITLVADVKLKGDIAVQRVIMNKS